jgi:type I restriction enzyme S subunit
MSVIPDEWCIRSLASLIRSHNSGIYKRQALYGDGCNIVGVSDIYEIDKVDGQSFANVPLSAQERAKHTLHPGDLLYGESSLVPEGIARTVYVTERGAGTAFAWHTRRYSVEQQAVLSSYLYYFLQSRRARAHMVSQSIQTAITGINTVAYFACPIVVPPLPEQRAIAEALSDVDGLLGALETLIAKKRAIKQAAMQQLLTGKTRLPGFSGEWETERLGDVADIKSGATPSTQVAEYWNGAIPWCTPTDITGTRGKYLDTTERRITQEGLANCSASLLPAGALLLCSRATIGEVKIARIDVCTNQGFKSLVCREGTSSEFLYYLLLTLKPQMLEKAIGSTFLEIGYRDVASIQASFPCERDQAAIATVLSDIDAEIAALEARREKARAIKQGMMQQLLTGRVRLVKPSLAKAGT